MTGTGEGSGLEEIGSQRAAMRAHEHNLQVIGAWRTAVRWVLAENIAILATICLIGEWWALPLVLFLNSGIPTLTGVRRQAAEALEPE